MARDIVCDMRVDEEEARQKGLYSDHNGVTLYFCGLECKQEFDADADRFMKEKPVGLYEGKRIEGEHAARPVSGL